MYIKKALSIDSSKYVSYKEVNDILEDSVTSLSKIARVSLEETEEGNITNYTANVVVTGPYSYYLVDVSSIAPRAGQNVGLITINISYDPSLTSLEDWNELVCTSYILLKMGTDARSIAFNSDQVEFLNEPVYPANAVSVITSQRLGNLTTKLAINRSYYVEV